jgi:hypothetical protein
MIAAVVAVLLAAPFAFANAETTSEPQPPGAPQFAIFDGVSGAPGDSVAQQRFFDVLRGVFLERTFVTEKAERPGRYAISVPINNRFVLLEGTGGPNDPPAYRIQLDLEWLKEQPSKPSSKTNAKDPKKPSGPRAVVSVFAVPAGVDPALVRIAPAADTVTFVAPGAPADSFTVAVARTSALLALEHLHHLDGELPDDERLQTKQASRTSVAAPMRR